MTDAGKAVDLSPSTVDGSARAVLSAPRPAMSVVAVTFLSFYLFAAVRAPVPAVNEPHYLSKAKHYWNPEWCRGDLFLESSNAHLVFYQTFGWPTLWLTLEQTAWLGRGAALAMLAFGWCRMISVLLPGCWSSLWVAWGYLFLMSCGNLSGEWIAGGVEAKVVSYGLLFWSIALYLEQSWKRSAFLAGLAVSFHPVVGLWGILSAAGAELFSRVSRFFISRSSQESIFSMWQASPSFLKIVSATPFLLIGALPGLLPALSIVGQNSFAADYIQVYYRLAHHLDPMQFPHPAWAGYAVLLLIWFVGCFRAERIATERWFAGFVVMTVVIALVGLAVGFRQGPPEHLSHFAFRMKILKLYPFRLCDTLIPLAASMAVVSLLTRRWESTDRSRNTGSIWCWALFGAGMIVALLIPPEDRNPSRMEPAQLADWLDVCDWISQNTPKDAVVLTPQESWAFKWYAERAEYVSLKDCPQDAAGIIEWNNRLRTIRVWAQTNYEGDGEYTLEELRALYDSQGITHILAGRLGPMETEPVYQNGTYRVYSLQERTN